jgi:hypothetical protein
MTAGRIARGHWWTNQFYPLEIIPPWFSMHMYHLVASVQRRSFTHDHHQGVKEVKKQLPSSHRYLTQALSCADFVKYSANGFSTADAIINWSINVLHEPGSSVSIVSGYGLDDRAIEVRFPAECSDRLSDPLSLLSNGYWGSFTRG